MFVTTLVGLQRNTAPPIGYHYPVHKPLYGTAIAKQICSQMFVEVRYKLAIKFASNLSSEWRSSPCPSGTIFCGRSELTLVRTAAPSDMRQIPLRLQAAG